uniref:non-specific serine/threonine protein kinase n=1 Tax=Anopheles culicifacies TaxID=139723 RepID=A0A182MB78_9DIPT
MAVWGKVKIASTTTTSKAPLARTPSKAGSLFSETLTAALGKRKSKFKDITDELNQHINNEEREELYQRPLFNADKIRRMMERIVEKQFDVDEEEMRYVYNPAKNLKMCQNISKQIKDRMKAMNFKRTSTELDVPKIEISFDTPNRDRFLRDDFHNKRESYAVLGRGSYGVVIKASYRGRPVAVKILEKRRTHRYRCRYDSLLNEANALNLRHDNIVTVLKIVAGAQYGLVLMDRFDGYCLQQIIGHQRNDPIAVQHKLLILCDIISGLCFCHRHNIVHLDVKPQNVIVTVNATVTAAATTPGASSCVQLRKYLCKLCDFGSSMMLDPWQRSETLVNRGTIRYMAPELLRGQYRTTGGFTERADIYSFGVTMWQLDEGRFPYEEITCNEVIAYNVVKKGLRPDSITSVAFDRRMINLPVGLREIGCLHGSLRASISLTGGVRSNGGFESDAVDDVLKRQGILVEYRAMHKRRKKRSLGALWTEAESSDQELNGTKLNAIFCDHFSIPSNERVLLKQMMRSLYSKCWLSDPASRPDAPTVRATIHQALERIILCKCAKKR